MDGNVGEAVKIERIKQIIVTCNIINVLLFRIIYKDDMEKIFETFRVKPGKKVRLDKLSNKENGGITKEEALDDMDVFKEQLHDLQERLYASDSHSLLIILQAMDAAGKDGAIEHVMRGVNPQGCQVFSFKQPTSEDYEHDFLWRHYRALPERGRIGIHNRSHYEYVLICKVHPQFNLKERIPGYNRPEDFDQTFWESRYESIRHMESHLHRNGTTIVKFFLHVSKEEQKKRFLERINDEKKNWKFSSADIAERGHWDAYMKAYEDAMEATSTADSPWYIIPADHKWFARLAVGKIIVDTLEKISPQFPELPEEEQARLASYQQILEDER